MVEIESDIETKFYNWTKKVGLTCIKLNLQGRRGWPDRMVMSDYPKIIFIEFKRGKEQPRNLQKHIHKELGNKGWRVFFVSAVEDAKHLCRRYLL